MMRLLIAAAAGLMLLAGAFLLPVTVPYTVSTPGRILPAREWTLVRSDNGTLETLLRDHAAGTVAAYAASLFDRGDAVHLVLRARAGAAVAPGDTIGTIVSSLTDQELVRLSGTLAATRATLDLYRAGEKQPVIDEARRQVERAEEQVRQQERAVARLRTLRRQQLVAAQALEEGESLLRVLEAEAEAARARLATVETGARPQQLALTRTEMQALEDEIETLRARRSHYTITSPIPGRTARLYAGDTLVAVQDTSAFVVVMPVPRAVHRDLLVGQRVDVRIPGLPVPFTTRIRHLGDTVHLLGGRPMLLVTATLAPGPYPLLPGATATCAIRTEPLPLPEYLTRTITAAFR